MGYISAILICLSISLTAWLPYPLNEVQANLPQVFQFGESELWTCDLQEAYSVSLLKACHNDALVAFQHWRHFTQCIQQLTQEQGLYQPGLQLWIKAFWNKEGHLSHIGYATRNEQFTLKHDQWQSIFEQLISENTLTGQWDSGLYHLGSLKMH